MLPLKNSARKELSTASSPMQQQAITKSTVDLFIYSYIKGIPRSTDHC